MDRAGYIREHIYEYMYMWSIAIDEKKALDLNMSSEAYME